MKDEDVVHERQARPTVDGPGTPEPSADDAPLQGAETGVLSAATVGDHLVRRGLVGAGTALDAVELGGGVSNAVLAVSAPGLAVVVKQALPRLRVAEEWLAKQERVLTEAEALRLVGRLAPGAVPGVLDVDPGSCTIVIERAPEGWRPWKELLLEGEADSAVGARVGAVLGTVHGRTAGDPDVAARFGDEQAFDQLRVDPYYGAVARRWPELARAIRGYVEPLERSRVCLVHGDCSPKNVLVDRDGLWLIDFEVAHVGDPAFDLAFMLNHLFLKALHRPGSLDGYRGCAEAFLDAYEGERGPEAASDPAYVLGHVGCLMVARVDGKSPAEYLGKAERLVARSLGTRLLLDPPDDVDGAWELVAEMAAG